MSASDERRDQDLTDIVLEQLRLQGVDVDAAGRTAMGGGPVKIVCINGSIGHSLTELGQHRRDQVIMVRIDETTARQLDAWVETDTVRSRSEAAALFIREGLGVRARELEEMRSALDEVERARRKLKARAEEVLGNLDDDDTRTQ